MAEPLSLSSARQFFESLQAGDPRSLLLGFAKSLKDKQPRLKSVRFDWIDGRYIWIDVANEGEERETALLWEDDELGQEACFGYWLMGLEGPNGTEGECLVSFEGDKAQAEEVQHG